LWKINQDGFVAAYEPKPEIVLAGEKQQIEYVSQNTFAVSTLNDRALRKLVETADAHQINLYLANSPAFEDLFANTAYQTYYQSMQAYLQEVAIHSTNTHYISSVKTFTADKMQNPDHLIVSGAEEYTHWLIGVISQISR
jgi:hypothetical protein